MHEPGNNTNLPLSTSGVLPAPLKSKGNKAQAQARAALSAIIDDPGATASEKIKASAALLKAQPKRKYKKAHDPNSLPDRLGVAEIQELRDRLKNEPGLSMLLYRPDSEFLRDVKARAERSLYFLCKFILNMPDLDYTFHRPVAEFLTNIDSHRSKLLMLPVVHLKTSLGSQGLPIFMLIQPANNRFFPGLTGCDLRIALCGETVDKAKENLSFIARQFQENRYLRYFWRDVCWAIPKQESPRWSEDSIEVRRTRIKPEPSITAIGVESGLHQRHYELIIMDDLITLKAAQSSILMGRAQKFRDAIITRRDNPATSIMIGIGTHWGPNDIYVPWKKEKMTDVMCRSIIEGTGQDRKPIWPSRYPVEEIEKIRSVTSAILFSLNYMNIPVSASFTGLDWKALRDFQVDKANLEGTVAFQRDKGDETLARRILGDDVREHIQSLRGKPLGAIYKSRAPKNWKKLAPGDVGWGKDAYLRQKYSKRMEQIENA